MTVMGRDNIVRNPGLAKSLIDALNTVTKAAGGGAEQSAKPDKRQRSAPKEEHDLKMRAHWFKKSGYPTKKGVPAHDLVIANSFPDPKALAVGVHHGGYRHHRAQDAGLVRH